MDGWCLLATVAPGWYMTDELRAKLLNTFYTLLTSPSAELKYVSMSRWASQSGSIFWPEL